MKGTVRWYNPERAFGFIYSEEIGGDVFVHVSRIIPSKNGIKVLHEGDAVEFEIYTKSDTGNLRAKDVKIVSQEEYGNDNERNK